jgi:hypothetical protein
MAIVKSVSGSYALGFVLLAAVAAICLIVLGSINRSTPEPIPELRQSATAATPV